MSKPLFKYCPLCARQNLPIASFCQQCDADLMNTLVEVRRAAVAPENEVPTEALTAQGAAAAPVMQDSVLGPNAARAAATTTGVAAAGGAIAVNEPEAGQLPRADFVLQLELVENPALVFPVRPGQSVGRSERADVILNDIPKLEFISRAHARFTRRRTQWYVQYIAEGNSITVDGVESRDDSEIAVHEGSVVVLSFTPFRVKLGQTQH